MTATKGKIIKRVVATVYKFIYFQDPASKAAEKLFGIANKFDALASRKNKLYCNFVDAVTAFKENRDETVLEDAKKVLHDGRHAVNNALSDLIASIKEQHTAAAEKVLLPCSDIIVLGSRTSKV